MKLKLNDAALENLHQLTVEEAASYKASCANPEALNTDAKALH